MKKLLVVLPCLFFMGCASIRYVETSHGQIVSDKRQPLNIVGNPRLTCLDSSGKVLADGYFVRQLDDGSFLIDEFGRRYVVVKNPVCQFNVNGVLKKV